MFFFEDRTEKYYEMVDAESEDAQSQKSDDDGQSSSKEKQHDEKCLPPQLVQVIFIRLIGVIPTNSLHLLAFLKPLHLPIISPPPERLYVRAV